MAEMVTVNRVRYHRRDAVKRGLIQADEKPAVEAQADEKPAQRGRPKKQEESK